MNDPMKLAAYRAHHSALLSRGWRFLLALSLSLSASLSSLSALAASSGPADYEQFVRQKNDMINFEDDNTPWKEVETALPKPPEEAALIRIDIGTPSSNAFFVDLPSVEMGPDRVIRYTMVVVSSSGARNISFEGMRCDTAERRLYAFGRNDGSWSKARSSTWQQIEGGKLNQQHATLYREYFCTSGGSVSSTEEARRVLKAGGNPAVERARGQ